MRNFAQNMKYVTRNECTVLDAFVKIAKKRLLVSSCLSVRPHGKTRLPLDGFS